ncbi:MAG: adenosylcobinamide-phosphate synthase CbiB [Pseudomonadota bacterium]
MSLALLLDAVLGEPKWLWQRHSHPAVLMGRIIELLDRRLNSGSQRRAKGSLVVFFLCVFAACLGWLITVLGPLAEIGLAAILLAQKSLVQHVGAVAQGLRISLTQGKRDVAMIVGRDTASMTETDVGRAAIESGAENLSDGVIAPAFWFLVAGLPGILIYKIVNTADSMIGYRTPKYVEFGWAAARLDDLLNWVPARMTAVMIALPAGQMRQWRSIAADARQHRSPNAGWPEAAMARAINVALAGPRAYDGVLRSYPWVHPEARRKLRPADIETAIRQMWSAWAIALALTLIIAILTL